MKNISILLCLLLTPLAFAQDSSNGHADVDDNERIKQHDITFYDQNSTAYSYTNTTGDTMLYRLFLPPAYDSTKVYPLLLSLHGAGSRGNDNTKQLRPWVAGWMDDEVQHVHPCLILMPQCPKKQQWVNVPWKNGSYAFKDTPISTPMQLAKEIMDKVTEEYTVDKQRIYVMGPSMGGYGTWNFVMRYPELIAAAVPICGAGDPSMAETIKDIPIWAFHGDIDHVVPLSGSSDMITALNTFAGSDARLTIYEGVAHNSYERAWYEPGLVDWIFKQTKQAKQ